MAKRLLQQVGAQIGNRAALLFRAVEQRLMNMVAQGDRDPSGLTL
jgi:hypothetical protein